MLRGVDLTNLVSIYLANVNFCIKKLKKDSK